MTFLAIEVLFDHSFERLKLIVQSCADSCPDFGLVYGAIQVVLVLFDFGEVSSCRCHGRRKRIEIPEDVLPRFWMTDDVIKHYSYCLRRHFQHLVDDDYPVVFGDDPRDIALEKRQVIHEVLRQVEFIDRELEDFRYGLGRLATT